MRPDRHATGPLSARADGAGVRKQALTLTGALQYFLLSSQTVQSCVAGPIGRSSAQRSGVVCRERASRCTCSAPSVFSRWSWFPPVRSTRVKARSVPACPGLIAGVTITAPRPVLPASGTRLTRGQTVSLEIENASTNGQRPLVYQFEGSSDAGFAAGVFRQAGIVPGSDGRTSIQVPGALSAGRTYYWRVQASDGANVGPYSAICKLHGR